MNINEYKEDDRKLKETSLFGNYSTTNMTDIFKNELVLEENNFHTLEQRTDKVALAQTIQNVLFFHKGTFPNQPELGVGIEDYLFEFANDETKNELDLKIKNQLNKFVPTTYNINFTLNYIKGDNKLTFLKIDFKIRDFSDYTETEFSLLFGRNQNNNKLISRLIA